MSVISKPIAPLFMNAQGCSDNTGTNRHLTGINKHTEIRREYEYEQVTVCGFCGQKPADKHIYTVPF